jgi:hypothetical protein
MPPLTLGSVIHWVQMTKGLDLNSWLPNPYCPFTKAILTPLRVTISREIEEFFMPRRLDAAND